MLRITRISTDGQLLLKLEGQLRQPWLSELECACGTSETARLDLASVTYIDAAGLVVLRDLMARGFEIVASSPFVAALLQLENT